MSTSEYNDVVACVDAIVDRLGGDIVVGAPLGLGKPNHILNELTRRAIDDPSIDLTIWSALSLSTPDWDSGLERRLVEPMCDRIFGDYPNLLYARLLREGDLPENIEVHQFYYPPGEHLGNPDAQQHHHSVNYTHVLRAMREADVNLVLQLLGVGELEGQRYYNLGSNADVTRDIMAQIEETDHDVMVVGQVNRNMPFMHGDAPISPEQFDAVLDDEGYDFSLFGPPNMPVSAQDHAIGLRVSSLLKDGGTLQIGIGSLGDAIGHATSLRHHDTDTYRDITEALGVPEDCPDLLAEYGGRDSFDDGLYGSTEMFVEAFLHLFEDGVLDRDVYDDVHIQRLVNEGVLDDGIDADALDALVEDGAIPERLGQDDVDYLTHWGIFHDAVEYDDGELLVDGESIPADIGDDAARERIAEHALGDALDNGTVLHAGFFLGSNGFYDGIRNLDPEESERIGMHSVQFTNQLYGQEPLKRLQRTDARFVNCGMKATLTGAVASDGLANQQVVSGVGGQFNFVDMAQELEGGRSIIMIRATRDDGDESNIVWNYGHTTIPRHLRDIVVTEYGVADLRDKCDAEVIKEMLCVADSRHQQDLMEKAKAEGKLEADWEIPEQYRNNYPETIQETITEFEDELPTFPYGTDLSEEERHLTKSLRGLQATFGEFPPDLSGTDSIKKALSVPEEATPYLERMDLDRAWTPRTQLYKRAVVLALAESGYV